LAPRRRGYGTRSGPVRAETSKRLVGNMRGVRVLAGITFGGLLATSVVLGAPASARSTVNGTGGDDHLRGTPSSDTIRGFGGNDVVHALAGGDLIFGGSGRDRVFAERGADIVRGGAQLDVLLSGQGADTTYGGAGRDQIQGDAGADVIFGGPMGDPLIVDGPGTDTIYGGLGNDTVILVKDGVPDTVTCGSGHDVVWGATNVNTVAADCEEVHVKQPTCRALLQRVLPVAREAARCGG
jgi:Ca2+-binding RTX toxin-like protein